MQPINIWIDARNTAYQWPVYDKAAALVKADNERRVNATAEAVQAALTEHNCDLVAVVVPNVAPDGKLELRAVVQIVAK